MTKKAIVDLYNFFKETGWGYMILTIHDSIFFEIKEEYLEKSLVKIKEIMEASGPAIMPNLKTPIDFDIGDKVYKTDILTGQKFDTYEYIWKDNEPMILTPQNISEDTEKVLKSLGISGVRKVMDKAIVLDDPQGVRVQVIEKLKVQTAEWLDKNKKWVVAFNALNK